MAGICAAHGICDLLFHADPYHTGRTVRGVYRMTDECPVKCEDCHIFAGSNAYDNCEIYVELYREDYL